MAVNISTLPLSPQTLTMLQPCALVDSNIISVEAIMFQSVAQTCNILIVRVLYLLAAPFPSFSSKSSFSRLA